MNVIHRPPFPALTRGEFWWEGMDAFPAWRGLQTQEPYGVDLGERPWGGRVALHVDTNDPFSVPGNAPFAEPFSNQVRAYTFLKENVDAVTDAVLRAILQSYPDIKEEYEEGVGALPMPPIDSIPALQNLIGIGNIWILPLEKDGFAYLGLDFGCAWDTEHGLGVMTHRERAFGVSQAGIEDSAFADGGKFRPD